MDVDPTVPYRYILRHGAVPYIAFKSIHTGRAEGLWKKMFHYFQSRRDAFLAHYHKRSNVESTFSMIKAKFGDHLRRLAVKRQPPRVAVCRFTLCLALLRAEAGPWGQNWSKGA